MKIITAENGQKRIKISKNEWKAIGKKNGWISKKAAVNQQLPATINVYGQGNAIAQQPGGQPFALEIEVAIGGGTIQIPLGQHIPEVQELYQAIGESVQQAAPTG